MIALLLFLIFSYQNRNAVLTPAFSQEPRIITCTVIEVDQSVACPEGGKMVKFSFTDPAEAKEKFDEWRLVAPTRDGGRVNTDAPLGTRKIQAGDKVKAVITETKFTQIASCEVRVWRNIKRWRQFRQGELVPNTLFTLPDDCQPWYGKN
jgi:hypothetical protein